MRALLLSLWSISCILCYFAGKQTGTQASRGPASVAPISAYVGQAAEVTVLTQKNLRFVAKIDTGAESSSLHATDIKVHEVRENGRKIPYVSFTTKDDEGVGHRFTRRVTRIDEVKNANGKAIRYYVTEKILFADNEYEIEMSLADRSEMTFKYLIGKNALRSANLKVDPELDVIVYENDGPLYVYRP